MITPEEVLAMAAEKQKEFEESEMYKILQEGLTLKYTDDTSETITLEDGYAL